MSMRKVLSATKPLSRNIHCSQTLHMDPKLKEIKKWQKIFQTPDDVPVYLKRGLVDRLWFGVLCIGTAAGLVNSFKYLYEEIRKP